MNYQIQDHSSYPKSYSVIALLKKITLITLLPARSRLFPSFFILILLFSSLPNLQAVTEIKPHLSTNKSIFVQLSVDEKNWIEQHPLVFVAGEPDWPPFDYIAHNQQYRGIANDYLDLISIKTGLQFDVTIDQWSNNLKKLREKKIDLLPAAYYTDKRSNFAIYSKPYFEVLDYFFIRDDLKVKTLDDLNGKRVAIPKDFANLGIIKQYFPKIKIITVNSFNEAIDTVLENHADMLFDTYASLAYSLKKEGISTIIPFKSTRHIGTSLIYMLSRNDEPMLASIIQKGLDAISIIEKQEIYDKWLGSNKKKNKDNTIDLTSEERHWLKQNPIIRFAGDPHWLPYEAFNNKGEYIGIVAEHLTLIEQRLGIKIKIIPTDTWAESIVKVKQGKIDILSETTNSDLKSHLIFTQPYLESPIVIMMNKDEEYVENIDQIKNRKIAMIREYGYVTDIIRKYPAIDFKVVNNIQDGLTDISTGKFDVLLATLAQASYYTSQLGINNIRIVGKTEFKTQLAFGMKKEFEPLVMLFNRALSSISQGDKQRIYRQWGKHKYETKIDYNFLTKLTALFFIILAIVFYWNRKLAKEIKFRKETESQIQTLIDNIPLQVIVTSLEGNILSANIQALNDYKIHKNEIDHFNISEFYYDINDRKIIIKELTKNGRVNQKIIQFNHVDGTVRAMMVSVIPIAYQQKNALLTIAVDMTARLEIEGALHKAKEQAEEAVRAKSEFLSNMSHEIRTPMNAIIGFTELLNEQVKDPKLKSFIQTIQLAGNNLLTLINDVLDLSKIEAGKLRIEKTACNPHDLFSEVGNIFMLKMREKKINFIFDIDPVIPQSLQIDATRLRQVLFNLIGNAVKFTDKGSIRVIARTDNENKIYSKIDLLIDIEDTGIGIPVDQQQLIFQDFEQSSGQDIREYGGTGLGLSISKKLVNLMGGKITLNSELGKGSIFTIRLTDVHVAPLLVDLEKKAPKPVKIISFLPASILIVDDVVDNRELLLANFAGTKLKMAYAENGLKAVNLVKQQQFDLILMDIRMPIMDGYQAAEKIKIFSNVPIVALTASVMTDEFERLKSNNFDGYLRKPVLKAELTHELAKFLDFEEIDNPEKVEATLSLTKIEKEYLPPALEQLKELKEQCSIIAKTNNISEIQIFSERIKDIEQQMPVSVISTYAEKLSNAVDSFDIAAIKQALNDFPTFLEWLEGLVEK